MAFIKIKSLKIKNYRSFGNKEQVFDFKPASGRPIAIVGYNNTGKTNLMNAIKHGLYESVREDTFELKDFHNLVWKNSPFFELVFYSEGIKNTQNDEDYTQTTKVNSDDYRINEVEESCTPGLYSKKWQIKNSDLIFYINFHKIKDEISTKKKNWGNFSSFLARHIEKLVEQEKGSPNYEKKKTNFNETNKSNVKAILEDTRLSTFISIIQSNYKNNLRNNACKIDFGLPNYEDIFCEMLFKIGLNGDKDRLIPIEHFGMVIFLCL